MSKTSSFIVDAALFDMDGTLVDSIGAVEAAWGKVALDLGHDPAYVIAATHGKRAIDNLKQFKPHLHDHELPSEVQAFEEMILAFADEHGLKTKARQRDSRASSFVDSEALGLTPQNLSPSSSNASSLVSSRRTSVESEVDVDGTSEAITELAASAMLHGEGIPFDVLKHKLEDVFEQDEELEELVDRSVKILPGVRRMIDSIPEGRYCVATSGAKTYAFGAMTRVGIVPPNITITADDPRLKAGKPAPDPFLLAAECLGFHASRCVVFEDSPSGIRAGVASGAIVVALCTSHERTKIENCGAHYLLENMEQIHCFPMEDGRLKFEVTE